MVEIAPTEEDILKMLQATQPPAIPDEVFSDGRSNLVACRKWHKNSAAALLGGLQTDPQFHANGVRFDWLLRLVLSKADGIAVMSGCRPLIKGFFGVALIVGAVMSSTFRAENKIRWP
jgi:hypothetical protein